ncbi:DUF2577 family protein [Paenibacillus sp. HN-1]|uniref:DUF2577 family protein n=1 Tax=Paenibacillus TaxID=44249 RepID=UPI001CA88EC2|nr:MULTISPECIES: DUF2577 family protein [Paenibacillus]MBY9080990.1 DUF2577 family protein [Paenibacillus sp. CGMCC 1.18879]MBY9084092.1 DUF2577 family protein [Paenibacillus sinensis]
MANGYDELHSALHEAVGKRIGSSLSSSPAELGTITETGLKLDSFKHEIQDYLLPGWTVKLELPAFTLQGSLNMPGGGGSASFSIQPTEIEDVVIDLPSGLQPGDRVLVLPVNGGNDFVVMCRVVDSSE